MPLPLSFRGGAVRFSFFPVAFGYLVVFGCCGFFPFGNKFLIIKKKKKRDRQKGEGIARKDEGQLGSFLQ